MKSVAVKRPFLERRSTFLTLVAVIFALEILSAFAIVGSFGSWSDRANFGDMFGAINSLFSGLALAGVVYAILLQRQELALQRQELELTRAELERAATAQEASVDLLKRQVALAMDAQERQASSEKRAVETERRRALPIFQIEQCSYGGSKMDFELNNHGAPISDLEVRRPTDASVQLVYTDTVPTGGKLRTVVHPSKTGGEPAFSFELLFTDVNGERRALRISFASRGRKLGVAELPAV